jgi:hypothetical protein
MIIPPWLKAVAAGCLVVAVIALGAGWYHSIGERAVLASQEAATRHALDSLARVSARVDSVYVRDTLTLTHETTRYVTVRDTLLVHLTDTIRVKEYVQAADSVVRACSAVVTACDQRHSVDSATATGWERMYKAERAARPSVVLTIGKELLIGLAGFGAGRILK